MKPPLLPESFSSGLYLHIPFCRQACHYCDFHFSTRLENRSEMLSAMETELKIRLEVAAPNKKIASIYLGGGTPSLLMPEELDRLFQTIHQHTSLAEHAEITLEANPEDVHPEMLRCWKEMGINRLSIGLQSSSDDRLKWMNRSHSAARGEYAVKQAQDAGFQNISIDLMFGFPGQTRQELETDLQWFLSLNVVHLSAYHLTLEPATVFGHQLKKGKLQPLPEEESANHFLMVLDALEAAGYSGYEISNFARPGFEAIHNRNYWLQKPFIGIGPSAHGFDGKHLRYANTASNAGYIRDVQQGGLSQMVEEMSPSSLANEFVLTRLRMKEGLPAGLFQQSFGPDLSRIRKKELREAEASGWISYSGDSICLTRQGRLMADYLAMQLFLDEEDFLLP